MVAQTLSVIEAAPGCCIQSCSTRPQSGVPEPRELLIGAPAELVSLIRPVVLERSFKSYTGVRLELLINVPFQAHLYHSRDESNQFCA